MEQYSFILQRRFYPGHQEVIPPQLPSTYESVTSLSEPTSTTCGDCLFNQGGLCTYWNAPIKENYVCDIWEDSNFPPTQPPTPPSCLTGFTVPILLMEDFNDIGVYTPFDGLVLQRDVINNFIYQATGLTVTVLNTSALEFKKFLHFGNYVVDWGDNSPPTIIDAQTQSSQHLYVGAGQYTIGIKQTNPWGTTRIEKNILLPYTSQSTIPNPFGVVSIHPPNVGQPIACNSIYQSYIFSGDSNPDVYDFFSSHYVDVPFPITGYTTNSRLSLLKQYGADALPPTGVTTTLVENLSGEIVDVTNSYTSYTINNIHYTDIKDGETFFVAFSTGLDSNNLEWECCDDTEIRCDCPQSWGIEAGEWETGVVYMQHAIVTYDSCCWICAPRGTMGGCGSKPGPDTNWEKCGSCVDLPHSLDAPETCADKSVGFYTPTTVYYPGQVVSFNSQYYVYNGNINGGVGGTLLTLAYIDNSGGSVSYVDNYGVWDICYMTHPLFSWVDWEQETGQSIDGINYSLWTLCEDNTSAS